MTPEEILKRGLEIMGKKTQDYTDGKLDDRHQNFERSALLTSWFTDNQDKVYVTLIGVKIARLAALLSNNKTPNNESIEDTFVDLVNYCALWGSKRIISSPSIFIGLEQAPFGYACPKHNVRLDQHGKCVMCG